MELVSIVIPNYNGGNYIGQAIESAINQTYKNIEIIVVDNASTDNSVYIVEKYLNNNVKLIKNKSNMGIVKNHNKAIELSNGEYVVVLSSDDYLDSNFVETCISYFKKYSTCGIVATDKHLVNENNQVIDCPNFYEDSFFVKGIYHNKVLLMTDPFSPSQVMIRKKCLYDERVGGMFSEAAQLSLDTDLWFRLGMIYDVVYLDKKLSYYRHVFGKSLSKSYEDFKYIFQHYLTRLRFKDIAGKDEYLSKYIQDSINGTIHRAVRIIKELLINKDYNLAFKYLCFIRMLDNNLEKYSYYRDVTNYINECNYTDNSIFDNNEKEYLLSLKQDKECKKEAPYELPFSAIKIK